MAHCFRSDQATSEVLSLRLITLINLTLQFSFCFYTGYRLHKEHDVQQECIPAGCVPPTAVAIRGGALHQEQAPLPLRPGTPPPKPGTPEFTRHPLGTRHPPWTRSPSTFPLAVGLDLIPLNFPLGCGPGADPPQFPPWLWACTRSPSTSPLGVGLETPPETCCKACWDTTCNACWDTDPPLWTDTHL